MSSWMMLVLLQAATIAPPAPQPPVPPSLHGGPAPIVCAVGGERFSAWRPATYSTYGQRPDGKPYSYLPFPFPLPECPGNRLVMFDDFTPAEVARLAGLIAGPDYRRMTAEDTPYYRAAWLATTLGRPAPQALGLLLSATWEAKGGAMVSADTPARIAKAHAYQAEFAARVAALPASVAGKDRVWLEARAANALRETGRFAAAEAMRTRALARPEAQQEAGGWSGFLARLGPAIARRDASAEPLDLIPDRQVASVCVDRADALSAFDRSVCARPEPAKAIDELRATRTRGDGERATRK